MNQKQLREVSTYYEDVWLSRLENGASDGCVHYGLHIDGMSSKPKINTNRLIENTLVRELPPRSIEEGWSVLDLGCGIGGTLKHLCDKKKHAWELSGVCSSPKESRVAQMNLPSFVEVSAIDFHDEFWADSNLFDLHGIYAVESLCQSWDRQAVLANVKEALIPGGVFLVLDAMLDGDAPDDGKGSLGEKSLSDLYRDICDGFHVPDLYEVPLMTELVNAGFDVEQELDFTPNVAESIFASAGRAIYTDGTNAIPLRKQLHGLACVGMAGLLAHKKLRYTLTIARKPEEDKA
tara:strand:- start:2754 stop:3629 length:876 start_codon:yes stop_codon:yes gene_type:complete